MFCSKCGNEVKENEQFCGKCGNKMKPSINSNKKEKIQNEKNIKKHRSKLLVVIIVCIVVLAIISIGVLIFNSNKDVITSVESNAKSEFEHTKVCERNKQGFLVDKNDIIYENYDEKSNLVSYSIKNGDNTASDTLSYEYDDLGRVTKLTSNNKGAYVKVAYASDTNKIEKIEYNVGAGSNMDAIYNFIYSEESDYPIIYKQHTNLDGIIKDTGYIVYKEVTLEDKKYVLSLETSENINSYEDNKFIAGMTNSKIEEITKTKYTKRINLKKEDKNNTIFDILELIPLDYAVGYVKNPQDISTKAIMVDNIIAPEMSKIISNGPIIYEETEDKTKETTYDKKNRILHSDTQYYKYNDINDKEYEYSVLLYADSESLYAVGMSEEDSKKYRGTEIKLRVYLDDDGQVTKIEEGEEQYLENDIASEKLEDYKKYIENNKVDTPKITFNDLEEQVKSIELEENTRNRRK